MAVPKKRTPKAKRNQRRSHHALKPKHLVECPFCKKMKLPHRACGYCQK